MEKKAAPTRRFKIGKIATLLAGAFVFAAMAIGLYMVAFPKRIAAATIVDGIDLSLLSRDEARKKLETWWTQRQVEDLALVGPSRTVAKVYMSPVEIGVAIDYDKTIDQLPRDEFSHWLDRTINRESPAAKSYHLVLDESRLDYPKLEHVIDSSSPELKPAGAKLDANGSIVLTPEVSSMRLVKSRVPDALRSALTKGTECELPAEYGNKEVPDSVLAQITDVVTKFSTNFSTGDRSRSQNLKIAAEKLDGVVLMPGERFSFNEFVGERSPANGFYKAGVYRQGKHEIDYGGGVCQVSTTLFNAVALANLKIEVRNNHTFSVPYVPIGRDAAVAFGTYDMVFVNTMTTPIAIDSEWKPGRLTFSILGVKDESMEVRLVPVVTQTWKHEPLYVEDPSLKPGEEKEIEKGGNGYRATTTRIVLKDGVEVSRETLCKSYYKGGPKIIAKGPAKSSDKPVFPPKVPPIIDSGL